LPIPWPFWIPAWLYIVRELLLNALVGQLIQEGSLVVRVNVFAHLGGAGGGLLFIYFFLHPDVFAQRR
jgi:membrane associated rhomboid family serine protease